MTSEWSVNPAAEPWQAPGQVGFALPSGYLIDVKPAGRSVQTGTEA